MGIKSRIHGIQGLRLGTKSRIHGIQGLRLGIRSYSRYWQWELSPEFIELKDCDRELSPILGIGNGN